MPSPHVIRTIYGFELDVDRVRRLTERYPQAWQQVEADVQRFVDWPEALRRRLAEA